MTSCTTPRAIRHRHGARCGPTPIVTTVPACEKSELMTVTVFPVSRATALRQALSSALLPVRNGGEESPAVSEQAANASPAMPRAAILV